jgi:hypothetical protein
MGVLEASCLYFIPDHLRAKKNENEFPALGKGDEGIDMDIPDETFIPHYQRVKADGGDDSTGVRADRRVVNDWWSWLSSQVPIEDLKSLSAMLVKGLEIRERYMRVSHQAFPSYVKR